MSARNLSPLVTFRRVFRSLSRRRRYVFGFLFAGILGLSSNLYLDSLENSIRGSLGKKSRELLTGDVSISVRRLVSEEESGKITEFLKPLSEETTRSLDLYSMLATQGGTRMVQVVAIEGNHPLYGRIELEKGGTIERTSAKDSLGNGRVWVDPDVRDSFGLRIGERIRLGDKDFTVSDFVLDDTSNTWRGFVLAPRVMMSIQDLWGTGLIRKGSTLWDRTYARLKPGVDSRETARKWNADTSDSAIRSIPHEEASEQVAKLSSRLNDYLGLVGLTTLFLALVGIAFLFQTELRRRLRMIGTLRAIGDSTGRIGFEIALEAAVLGFASAVIAILAVHFTLPFASDAVARIAGASIDPRVSPVSASITLFLGALIGYCLASPFASRVGRMKPSALFQDESNLELPWLTRDAFAFVPLLTLFFLLSAYQSRSWKLGSIFFVLSSVAVFGLYFFGSRLFAWIGRLRFKSLSIRIAARSLARHPWSSISGFVALGIGTLLLSLIPSLQAVIESEIERPEGSKVPSLFLFDIQEEQLTDLRSIATRSGAELDYVSPMIRARLETLNGKAVEKALEFSERSTREQEEEERSRNRGFNLSYRSELSDSEAISSGRQLKERFNPESGELPEVTLERKFAERLGVGVGDRIGFDVQGIPIEATVVGLRRVRWSSFQPNFFVVFQPGVLEDAPKTFLAGVPSTDQETRKRVQEEVVQRLPNVSVIQVDEMVRKILSMFDQMGVAVRITAFVSLLTGAFVFFAIARRQAELRRRSALLLKAVGASTRNVLSAFLWEFGVLSLSAALLGSLFSTMMAKGIAWVVFERADAGFTETGFWAILCVVGVALGAVSIAAWPVVRAKPWRLLQDEGER